MSTTDNTQNIIDTSLENLKNITDDIIRIKSAGTMKLDNLDKHDEKGKGNFLNNRLLIIDSDQNIEVDESLFRLLKDYPNPDYKRYVILGIGKNSSLNLRLNKNFLKKELETEFTELNNQKNNELNKKNYIIYALIAVIIILIGIFYFKLKNNTTTNSNPVITSSLPSLNQFIKYF